LALPKYYDIVVRYAYVYRLKNQGWPNANGAFGTVDARLWDLKEMEEEY
jgi:hypothetical protein